MNPADMIPEPVDELPFYKSRAFDTPTFPIPTAAGAAAPQPLQVAHVQVEDIAARSWRITWNPPTFLPHDAPDFAYGNNEPTSVLAIVEWGTGSAKHRALVDWKAGTSIVVHGSTVNVSVQPPANMNSGGVAGLSVQYSATIVPDRGGREREMPTRTINTGRIVASPGAAVVAVPAFARRMRWIRWDDHSAPPTQAGTAIEFLWSDDSAIASPSGFEVTLTGSLNWPGGIGLPVPINARFVQVQNQAAVEIGLLLEFDLDLG